MPSMLREELVSRFIESLRVEVVQKAIDFGYALATLEAAEADNRECERLKKEMEEENARIRRKQAGACKPGQEAERTGGEKFDAEQVSDSQHSLHRGECA